MKLLIVESPTKAKKIQKYLGPGYIVKSSYGHFVELDTKNLDKMIDNNFTPLYKLMSSKKKVILDLKSVKTKDIILAADDDREGDAIAWHCGNLLKIDFKKSNRIVFNEISKKSIEKSLKNPVKINLNSVNAQRSRQLIDLIIGFKLSPLLWKHIKTEERGLSAGRVQSCLLKILIDHENDILNFKSDKSFKITGDFKIDDDILECLYITKDKLNEKSIETLFNLLKDNRQFIITDIKNKKEKTYPPPPLITSTLQQSAQNELGFSVIQTMSIAQKLYENGKITYMRTDSTFIAEDFTQTIKEHIILKFGDEYYKEFNSKKKVKGAQEAHEAIRPTDINYKLSDSFTDFDKKLYNLILKRTIISNMQPAVYDVYEYILKNDTIKTGLFVGKQKFLEFPGFLDYSKKNEIEQSKPYKIDKICNLLKSVSNNIETNPPQYLNESSIIKRLESSGVGRPSTYASIISTLYNRNYTEIKNIPETFKDQDTITLLDIITKKTIQVKVGKQSKRVMVTDLGKTVLDYLLKHFSMIINIEFTSSVENDLDQVSNGNMDWNILIQKIYNSFISIVNEQMKFKNIKKIEKIYLKNLVIKKGKYGDYLHDPDNHTNYNINNYLKYYKKKKENLSDNDIEEIIKYPKLLGEHDGSEILIVLGPHGYYMKYGKQNYKIKSKNSSLKTCIQLLL
jgi:DNA topoisomerase-1